MPTNCGSRARSMRACSAHQMRRLPCVILLCLRSIAWRDSVEMSSELTPRWGCSLHQGPTDNPHVLLVSLDAGSIGGFASAPRSADSWRVQRVEMQRITDESSERTVNTG
jgi:hypothetical protein